MREISELVQMLRQKAVDYDRISGSMPLGIAAHYWKGRAEGLRDAIREITDGTGCPPKVTEGVTEGSERG